MTRSSRTAVSLREELAITFADSIAEDIEVMEDADADFDYVDYYDVNPYGDFDDFYGDEQYEEDFYEDDYPCPCDLDCDLDYEYMEN
jgi:hypothetical protein